MLFSDERAIKFDLSTEFALASLLDTSFGELARRHSLKAIVLCRIEGEDEIPKILGCHNLPIAPFLSSLKDLLSDTLKECFNRFPEPHIHSIKDTFVTAIERTRSGIKLSHRVIFIPMIVGNMRYVFFGFPNDESLRSIPKDIFEDLAKMTCPLSLLVRADELESRLVTLESYVKEVGHDIASAVQAIVAKLRLIRRGRVIGESALKKVKESEEEIMAAYRVAENLGIAVDPNYNIQEGAEFNLIDAVRAVIEQYRSEANEHHISLRYEFENGEIEVWADRKAIESAIGQYLFNGIKYAWGGSYIRILASQTSDKAYIHVIDKGIPLLSEEANKIWNFGFRGRESLERHVNGSGIGLFTVKKIISAHGGTVSAESSLSNPHIVTFSFAIPKREILKKVKLLV